VWSLESKSPRESEVGLTGTSGPRAEAAIKGKVVVITGATSGIGQVAAEKLAAMGARIVFVARDTTRGESALARLKALAPGAAHTVHYADLSLLAETKRVAAEIAAAEPRIDVLINNAGAIFGSRQVTAEGFERTFALNHMSYFILTAGLRDRLVSTPQARIVNVASEAHRSGNIDFSDLQREKDYKPFAVYGTTKLCNILFTRELARRLTGTGVTANSLHPGFVATRYGDEAGGLYAWAVGAAKFFAITPEEGAATTIYLASSPDVAGVTGGYFSKCRPAMPRPEGQDDELARQLWEESEKIATRSPLRVVAGNNGANFRN
jgi:NAD(P)-dependent dehydrogenase (short-subunit alcohol dehydrogenase family)